MAKPATKSTTNALDPAATWEPIDSLTPWDKNPRKNDGEPVDRVAKSIERFGFAAPIVARAADRVIIAGHTRWKAARKLGMDKVPVRFVDLDPDQAAALALADNRLTEITPWDDDGLAGVLRDLEAAQVDLDGLGWDGDELKALLESTAPIDASETDDDVPEVDDGPAVSARGEVYHLGPHRLACGDSTRAETWLALLGAERIQMVWTDPPYGIAYKAVRGGRSIENDATPDDALTATRAAISETVSRGTEAIFVCCGWTSMETMRQAMADGGVAPKACIVWDKGVQIQNLDRFAKQHEFILYAGPYGGQPTVSTDVWLHPRDFKPDHPTPKPISLVAQAIESASVPGDIVADAFGGSGSTLIAAAQTGRVARLIELDPKYCDLIRRRWHRYAAEHGLDVGDGLP